MLSKQDEDYDEGLNDNDGVADVGVGNNTTDSNCNCTASTENDEELPLEGVEALFADSPKYSCMIPWEALVEPRRTLFIGVYGSTGGGDIIPVDPIEPGEDGEGTGTPETPLSEDENWDGITGITFTNTGTSTVDDDLDFDDNLGSDSDFDIGADEVPDEGDTKEFTIVIPTVWAECGTIKYGARIGEIAQEPTPGLYEQIANTLSDKADNLEYDGLDLSLKSGDRVLSTVQILGGGSAGEDGTITIEGVLSFNGRKGAVKPQIGDYTASMVGALPAATSIPSKTSQLDNDSGFITQEKDPTVPDWAKQPNPPTYSATDIGADPAGTAVKEADKAYDDAVAYTDDKLAGYIPTSGGTVAGSITFADSIETANENVNARTTSAKRTVISSDGVSLVNANGDTTLVSTQESGSVQFYTDTSESGLVRLSGVANGTQDTDVVNKRQVQAVVDALSERIDNISTGGGNTGGGDQPPVVTTGVTSFNGRTGTVIPQSGDYSADMISGMDEYPQKSDVEESINEAVLSSELKAGEGITIEDKNISVTIPTKALTQAEYNALDDDAKRAQILYIIKDYQNTPSGGGNGNLPSGSIIIWSGTTNNIPDGWALCNGENGTPDLQDRFVLGAGTSYGVGSKGGEATHTLTTTEIPAHGHFQRIDCSGSTIKSFVSTQGSGTSVSGMYMSPSYIMTGTYKKLASETVGGSGAHNNMPPYYTLCYIMKL